MATQNVSTRLRRLADFREWKDAELVRLSREMTELRLSPDRAIEREGSYQRQFAIIVEGRVRLQAGPICGAMLGAGDTIGLGTVLRPGASMTTATTETETTLLVATVREFNNLVANSPSFSRFVAVSAVRANKHTEDVLQAMAEAWRMPALAELSTVEPAHLTSVAQVVA